MDIEKKTQEPSWYIESQKPFRKIINRVFESFYLSVILKFLFTPIYKICNKIQFYIKSRVRINGGTMNYDGIELKFPKNIGIYFSSVIHWEGSNGFELHVWQVMKNLIKNSDVFIDVGSHFGFYSVLAKKVNSGIKVIAYEPIKTIYDKNILFHQKNNISGNKILNIGVSDKNGFDKIFLPVSNSISEESTATFEKDSWQNASNSEIFNIEIIKLDQIITSIKDNEKLLIKIDVEGHEHNVLSGSKTLLKKIRPIVICEILPDLNNLNKNLLDLIDSHEYSIFSITLDGLFRMDKKDFKQERQFQDFLLIPQEYCNGRNFISMKKIIDIRQ